MNITSNPNPTALIFLGIEEAFFTSEGKKVEDSIDQFNILIERVKKIFNVKLVITSSWGEKADNLKKLHSQLETFPFKAEVIDAVAFCNSNQKHLKESEKIRRWLQKHHKEWNVKSFLVVGSFQALQQVNLRFPNVPILFSHLGLIDKIPGSNYGFVFSKFDVEDAYKMLATRPFSIESLQDWPFIEDPQCRVS